MNDLEPLREEFEGIAKDCAQSAQDVIGRDGFQSVAIVVVALRREEDGKGLVCVASETDDSTVDYILTQLLMLKQQGEPMNG